MDSIDQFSYLLLLKHLDDAENQREKQLKQRNKSVEPQIKPELRWSHWINFKAEQALKHVREEVFPWLRTAETQGSSFERYMQNAEFKINKPGTLIEVCNLIDALKISEQNQNVQGDLYQYLLVNSTPQDVTDSFARLAILSACLRSMGEALWCRWLTPNRRNELGTCAQPNSKAYPHYS